MTADVEFMWVGMDTIPCDKCKRMLSGDEPVLVVTTKTGWFRGDDKIEWFCMSCGPKLTKRPSGMPRGMWNNIQSAQKGAAK
jgi:hypothetical protein